MAVAGGPQRTCVGCRRVAPASELVRVARRGQEDLGVGRHLWGRGAWVCANSMACVEEARRRRAFPRALRAPVSEAAIERLRTEMADRGRMEQERSAVPDTNTKRN
ncbi:MAG: YlxR family protein [Acidimicrobiales bacterium]